MASSNESMYEHFKEGGFTWNIAIWALLLNVVGINGILLNASVIWVTLRTKSLHGTANCNLALGALFEILHQFGHLLFLYTAFSGQNFLPYASAVHICTGALFGLGSVALSIAFTALDRLLYVLFPFISFWMKPAPYLTGIFLICLAFCCQNVYIFYKSADQFPNEMITGSMDDILSQEPGKDVYNYISLVLNTLTLFFYIALGLKLKMNPATAALSDSGRIYRSILVLITVRLGGFFAMRLYRLFIGNLVGGPFMSRWYISQAMSLLLNISTASTGPILYSTSQDYRAAILREFRSIARVLLLRNSRVDPLPPPTQTQQRVLHASSAACAAGAPHVNNSGGLAPIQLQFKGLPRSPGQTWQGQGGGGHGQRRMASAR